MHEVFFNRTNEKKANKFYEQELWESIFSPFTSSLKNLMKYSKEISLFSENTCSGWLRQTWYDF